MAAEMSDVIYRPDDSIDAGGLKICFMMTCIKEDLRMALEREKEIMDLYGDEIRVVIISDGNVDYSATHKHTEFSPGLSIKRVDCGGLWSHRYLKQFLTSTREELLVKIDPDSSVIRKFKFLPGNCDVFGSFGLMFRSVPHNLPYIQGGCIGFHRDAVIKIISSGYLLDVKYRTSLYSLSYSKYGRLGYTSFQDAILYDVIDRVGLRMALWPEIAVFPNRLIFNFTRGDYSVIHPYDLSHKYKLRTGAVRSSTPLMR